ncbi:MAG: bifunctional pyr operon transcriptional regulator/uracil phosphoribosyltransferase, partial [Gemmatimonadales bacterium]|nr:bifunctional pyr operon transcriptional regulator/uracil phosphoribosyltransferase [Gemmatimonadales bacterium]
MTPLERTVVLDSSGIRTALERMASEVVSLAGGTGGLVLIGIQRRGADLAQRLAGMIAEREGTPIPLGVMDITLYRDDLQTIGPRPVVGETRLPVD